MKIKVKNLTGIYQSLKKLFNQDIDIRLAFRYSDSVSAIENKFSNYTRIQEKVSKKLGRKGIMNNVLFYNIPPENLEEYNSIINPLLEEEFEVEWEKIPLSKLTDLKLSMIDTVNLNDFIDKTK